MKAILAALSCAVLVGFFTGPANGQVEFASLMASPGYATAYTKAAAKLEDDYPGALDRSTEFGKKYVYYFELAIANKDKDMKNPEWALLLAQRVARAYPVSAAPMTSNSPTEENPAKQESPEKTITIIDSNAVLSAMPATAIGGGLSVHNGTTSNSIIKIISLATDKKAGSFFVRANGFFTMKEIPDGGYRLIFCFGGSEVVGVDKFKNPTGSFEFDNHLNFKVEKVSTTEGITTYTNNFRVTLHEVNNGNAKKHTISVAEFDKY